MAQPLLSKDKAQQIMLEMLENEFFVTMLKIIVLQKKNNIFLPYCFVH